MIDINRTYCSGEIDLTFIDPFAPEVAPHLLDHPDFNAGLLRARLQGVPTERFQELGPGDILFIDSSHVAKTGSDVVDYAFRILPALKTGVAVHIHDIFFPFEYPRSWVETQNRSWNEAYLIRAFLQGNRRWSVEFLFDWFYKCRREELAAKMRDCVENRGGSLWLAAR